MDYKGKILWVDDEIDLLKPHIKVKFMLVPVIQSAEYVVFYGF